MNNLRYAIVLAMASMPLVFVAAPVHAQSLLPTCKNRNGVPIACNSAVIIDKNGIAVDASNPLPTRAPIQGAAAWSNGAAAVDLRLLDNAQIQISGLSGGDSITITRSLDGTNYVPQSIVGNDYSVASNITTNGIYTVPAGGYLKWAKTGTASTPTVTIRAGS